MSGTPEPLGCVFISYSHDTAEHAQAVLELSNRLRSEGIDCVLDQYESSPPEGWPRWMDREINKAQFVLSVCTEGYYRRVMGEEKPGVGHGIAWEGNLIYQHLYDAGSNNRKFLPVLLAPGQEKFIPTPLRGTTRYLVNDPKGYDALYNHLCGLPPAEKPPLGKRRPLPAKEVKTPLGMLLASPIDVDLWNKAKWRATVFMFAQKGPYPPMLGIGFVDEEAAVKIFKGWLQRYGAQDEHEELRVSIIEGDIPGLDPGYTVHVGVNPENTWRRYEKLGLMKDGDLMATVSRFNRMYVPNSTNLANFKAAYRRYKTYFLLPVVISEDGKQIIKQLHDLRIYKHEISFRLASEIGEDDPDIVVCRKRGHEIK